MPGTIPRIKVIVGHYGSGKSELAVSLAMKMRGKGEKVALGDLDIVNVYFRSREKAQMLEEKGIKVVSSVLGHDSSLDLPAINSEIRRYFVDGTSNVILDVGGDKAGTNALAMFREDILSQGYEMIFTVNAYRPQTSDLAGLLGHLEGIELVSRMQVTGLAVTTHQLRETSAEDVLLGYALAKELSRERDIPIRYICGLPHVLEELPLDLEGEPVPIGMYLREKWM